MKRLLLTFVTSLAGLLLLESCVKSPTPVPPEVVIASGKFADGFTVELLRAELASQMTFVCEVKPAWFGNSTKGLMTGLAIGGVGVEWKRETFNGQLSEVTMTLQNNQEPLLFVLLKARWPDGSGLLNAAMHAHGNRYAIQRENGVLSKFIDRGTGSDDPAEMELHLQVEDGQGGWRDLMGPILPDAADGRAFAMVDAFPRRQAQLRLRALHAGQPPVEFSVPNPGHKPSFASLQPQSPPVLHDGGEFQVRCEGLKWESNSRMPSLLNAKVHFEAPTLPKDSVRLRTLLLDEMGNHLMRKGDMVRGYEPLPGEKNLLVRSLIEREESIYPWRENEVIFIAEGAFAASAEQQKAEITTEGLRLGCTAVTFRRPDPADESSRMSMPYALDFDVVGECLPEELANLQKEHHFGTLAVFPEASRSKGECNSRSYGQKTFPGIKTWFHMQSRWAGELKPGDRFRIGLLKTHVPEKVEFVLPIPEKPAITAN